MTPYRIPGRPLDPGPDTDEPRDREEQILGAMLVVLGGLRVAVSVAAREAFGVEPSVALIMTAIGLGLLLRRR
jgi:hypothetical protein